MNQINDLSVYSADAPQEQLKRLRESTYESIFSILSSLIQSSNDKDEEKSLWDAKEAISSAVDGWLIHYKMGKELAEHYAKNKKGEK